MGQARLTRIDAVREMAAAVDATRATGRMAAEALNLMENRPSQIYVLPVLDGDNKVPGILRLHDLVQAGLQLRGKISWPAMDLRLFCKKT